MTLYEIEVNTRTPVYPKECCCCGLPATTTVESDFRPPVAVYVAQHFPSCHACAPHFWWDLRGGWARFCYNAFLVFAGSMLLGGAVRLFAPVPGAVVWTAAAVAAILYLLLRRKPPRRLPADRPHARPFPVSLPVEWRSRLVLRFARKSFARRFRELNAEHVVRADPEITG